eukprot:COSAG01_NODE_6580_length_3596_cov_15.492994_2_plen_111_part_00
MVACALLRASHPDMQGAVLCVVRADGDQLHRRQPQENIRHPTVPPGTGPIRPLPDHHPSAAVVPMSTRAGTPPPAAAGAATLEAPLLLTSSEEDEVGEDDEDDEDSLPVG